MQEQINRIKEFHTVFSHPVNDTPQILDTEQHKLRSLLLAEELDEYVAACKAEDIVGIADAITDQLVIILGTAVAHGLADKLPALFNEVMDSNMSKLDDNGKPIINGQNGIFDPDKAVGKILKSSNYFEPNLKKILDE